MIAIERTLGILKVLSENAQGTSIKDLSSALDAPASTVHRLLRVLVRSGFVVQEAATRRYSLGPETLGLARSYLRRRPFVQVARPHLRWLTAQSEETSFATAVVGSVPICVAIEECDRPLRLFIEAGQRMPYHAAASARAILAFQEPAECERLLKEEPFEAFTHATPRSVDDVLAMLPGIRDRGYDICDEELEEHVTALSAPVMNAAGRVGASVTVVAPAERLRADRRPAVADMVREAARRMSVGCDGPGPADGRLARGTG